MNETDITIAIAKLDGKEYHKPTEAEIASGTYYQFEPDYLHSRDAIIPVIEKHITNWTIFELILEEVCNFEKKQFGNYSGSICEMCLTATSKQLCIALLKSTGGFVE